MNYYISLDFEAFIKFCRLYSVFGYVGPCLISLNMITIFSIDFKFFFFFFNNYDYVDLYSDLM